MVEDLANGLWQVVLLHSDGFYLKIMQSYDNGENWMVIQSQIGGCPITGSNSGGGQGTCELPCIHPFQRVLKSRFF